MSALIDCENEDEIQGEFNDLDNYMEQEDRERNAMFTGWGISLVTHTIVALILLFVVVASNIIRNVPPTRTVEIQTIELPAEEPKMRELEDVDIVVIHNEKITAEKTLITKLDVDVPDVKITTEDPDVKDVEPKGRLEAKADCETGSTGAFMAIGASGGGSGAFGRVKGGDVRRIGKAYGPNARAAKSALDAALRWLKRHQSENGMWDSDAYFLNCTLDGPKCEPGKNVGGADEALTGLSLMCFAGCGYDHRVPSQYQKTIQKGIDWLLLTQQNDGLIGKRNYEHPIATMALAELYAMTLDRRLKEPVEKAVSIILERQTKDGDTYPLGWDYTNPNMTRQDNSVSPWCVMCLKSAKAGGIDIGDGLSGAKRWLEGSWKASNPNWNTLDPYGKSIFPYTWNPTTGKTSKDHLSFSGSLCAVFLGYNAGDVLLSTLINDMTDRWFDTGKYKNNYYSLYYGSLSSFQYGDEHWKEKWGNQENGFVPWLIETQYKNGGCQDGTWPFRKQTWHGGDTSQVLQHTLLTLSLEVAFRYLPVMVK